MIASSNAQCPADNPTVSGLTYGNGLTLTRTFDLDGRLTAQTVANTRARRGNFPRMTSQRPDINQRLELGIQGVQMRRGVVRPEKY